MRLLIMHAGVNPNRGATALLVATVETLRKCIPNVDIGTLIHGPSPDLSLCEAYGLRIEQIRSKRQVLSTLFGCILCKISHKLFRRSPAFLGKSSLLQQYDAFIDLGNGDCFIDRKGIINFVYFLYPYLFGLILRKPIVVYAQSIGPLETSLGRFLAKFILSRAKLIMVREEISKGNLEALGIHHAYVTTDSAFLLSPAPQKRIEEIIEGEPLNLLSGDKVVGVAISQDSIKAVQAREGGNLLGLYLEIMAQLIDYLIDKWHAVVLLIPHNYGSGIDDDRIAQDEVFAKVRHKQGVTALTNEYSVEELKGIIGKCWVFIGTRFHANVSALSMCVPTVAIKCTHKTEGIFAQLGLENYVIDIRNLTFDSLASKVDDVWLNHQKIKDKLGAEIETVREKAELSAILVKELLDSLNLE